MRLPARRIVRWRLRLAVLGAISAGVSGAAAPATAVAPCSNTVTVPGAPSEVLTVDLNGDLRPDAVVASPGSGSIQVLLGTGAGGLAPPVVVATGGDPAGMATGDFDEDGHMDLAVTHPSRSELTVHRGRGDGTFEPPVAYYAPGGPVSVTSGEFTGDGILDLAVVSMNHARVYIFHGSGGSGVGDGTFATGIYYGVGASTHRPTRIRSFDLDRDGALDLVFAIPNIQRAGIMFGEATAGIPNGRFGSVVLVYLGDGLTDVIAGDVDHDGNPDVTAACPGSSRIGILNIGPGRTYSPVNVRFVTRPLQRLVAGDFDGDGVHDLAGISQDAVVIMDAAGFETTVDMSPGLAAIAAGDFDGNAVLDLVVTAPAAGTLGLLLTGACIPQWDPIEVVPAGRWAANGVPLCTAAGTPSRVTATPDGLGGVYAAWLDDRDSPSPTLRLGRLDASGNTPPGWPVNGLLVPGQGSPIRAHSLIQDEVGGVYVLLSDVRDAVPAVSLLRRAADGSTPAGWPAEGIRLTSRAASTTARSLVPDGSGGAIVVFETGDSLMAIGFTPAGAPAPGWPAGGRGVEGFLAGTDQSRGVWEACGDGAGGVYVGWRTYLRPCHQHGCPSTGSYLTLVSFTNASGWSLPRSDGRVLFDPPLRPDGRGGALSLRHPASDYGEPLGIVLDRLWNAGASLWSIDASWASYAPGAFAGDGTGGALLTTSISSGLRVHRRTAAGSLPAGWSVSGLQILPPMEHTSLRELVSDRRGGGFVTWSTPVGRPSHDLFVTYFTDRGALAPGWTSGGDPVCTAPGTQLAQAMCEDGENGVIVIWSDARAGGSHLYAQRFGKDLPVPIAVRFIDYEFVAGSLRLRWLGSAAAAGGVVVERADEEGAWAPAGHATVEDRWFEFIDSVPGPGETRWYRLKWQDSTGPRFTAAVEVHGPTPETPALSLRTSCVPAGPEDELVFTLGAASSGRLELFDSGGRRRANVNLSAAAGRSGRIRIGSLGVSVAGVYFARLRTSAGSTIHKFVHL